LLQLPQDIPLKLLNRNEQLAYWLNLYNITLLEQLIAIYPESRISDDLFAPDGILNQRLVKVSGTELSLNDIQFGIIFKIHGNNPLVMYGLFQGFIGGPNIRKQAYTGDTVFAQLRQNAEEFINSNRGTIKGYDGELRVSRLYQRNDRLFPDFEADLRAHLLKFTIGDYDATITNASQIVADVSDIHIADISGGYREFGGSAATSSAALLDSIKGTGLNPAIVNLGLISETFVDNTRFNGLKAEESTEIILRLNANRRIRGGSVIIQQDPELEEQNKDQEEQAPAAQN
jgi:hypothetical protein